MTLDDAFRRDDFLDCNCRLGGGARFGVKRAIYERNAIPGSMGREL
jgi:hypothetical protein